MGWFSKSKKESEAISGSDKFLVDIKSFSSVDHMLLRKKGLSIYLSSLIDIFCGLQFMNDPINVVRTFYAIYMSLHDSYVYGSHETYWRFNETTDVSI